MARSFEVFGNRERGIGNRESDKGDNGRKEGRKQLETAKRVEIRESIYYVRRWHKFYKLK